MKTRVVYPQMWLDEKFAECAITTKLLFCYLINNPHLKLTPYLHITDRQILFDTGLTSQQLQKGKEELQNLKWVYFCDNWVFHSHKCAYVDYEGNERVISSKNEELASIPEDIKEVFKGLMTGYKPNINHKSEIRNNKLKIIFGDTQEPFTEQFPKDDIRSITEEVKLKIAEKYNVPISFVHSKYDDLCNWLGEKPTRARGRDLQRTLMTWVKKDAMNLRKEDHAKSKIAYID